MESRPHGSLQAIYLRPSKRTPVQALPQAQAIAQVGLQGDHAHGGRRQVTLLDADAWQAACDELGCELDPGARRANLVLRGVSLLESLGRRLRIGEVLIEVTGETKPCRLMEAVQPGLRDALQPGWRGGAFGRVLEGGSLRCGDTVGFEEG